MELSISTNSFKLAQVFTISRGSRTQADVLTVTITRGKHRGWGECVPYSRYGETMESVRAQVKGLPRLFDRDDLTELLPAGAARNAVDCALWDLEAKEASRPVWDLAKQHSPKAVVTAYTLSLETPEAMNAQAAKNAFRPLLKTKLGGGEEDIERIRAVRAGALNSRIIVDANEGWTPELYQKLAPVLLDLGVEMVEQPLPAGQDDALLKLERVLPVCADESCHDRASLDGLRGKYDMVNIKLDKTGGLTEALALKQAALDMGFEVMVGCMVGSSLAMAPAILVAQGVSVVDLDGPLLLGEDRSHKLFYDAAGVHPARPELWG
jgi:L-alanine-DL-glutamate epimerase-like enolase superfamily enzyme